MEDTSIQVQLAELKKLTEENNRLLRAIRRDALIGGIIKFLIWIGLIGASYFFAAQLLAPYLEMIQGMQGGAGQDFGALIDQYRQMFGQ